MKKYEKDYSQRCDPMKQKQKKLFDALTLAEKLISKEISFQSKCCNERKI